MQCTICNNNSYSIDGLSTDPTCILCSTAVPNCTLCSSNQVVFCSACVTGYVLANASTCLACSSISNCLTCIFAVTLKCSAFSDPYVPSTDKASCVRCNTVNDPDFYKNATSGLCVACGYYCHCDEFKVCLKCLAPNKYLDSVATIG